MGRQLSLLLRGLGFTWHCFPHCRNYNRIFFFSLKKSALRGHRSFQLLSQSALFISFSDVIIWPFRSRLPPYEPELTQAHFPPLLSFVFSRHFTLNSGNLIPSPLQGVFVFPQINLREAHQSLCVSVCVRSRLHTYYMVC